MHPKVHSETERLEALRALQILDTPPRETYDRVTALCAEVFGCDKVLIALVDETRNWFLSTIDDSREAPRERTFSEWVITDGRPLAIPDALEDDRFADMQVVAGAPYVRSFMAYPIRCPSGYMIGTLGLADTRPNRFGDGQLEMLRHFAGVVEDLIALHSKEVRLSELNTDLSEKTARLENSYRVFGQAEKVAKIGFWEIEIDSHKLSWSDEIYAIYGLPNDHALSVEEAIAYFHEADRERVTKAVSGAIEQGKPFDFEGSILAADGVSRQVRAMGECLEGDDRHPTRLVGVFQDVSEAYHARVALQRAADHDSLTNVYNRHAFDRVLQDQIREHRQTGHALSVMLIDLDGFKDINDTFGHLVGDVVLEETSSRISGATPQGATLARWGGDEFAIIPPIGASNEETEDLGKAILEAVERRIAIAGRKVSLSATCGFAQLDSDYSAKELVRRADLALYYGKKREPGRVHKYDTHLEQSNHVRQTAIEEVRRALDEDRIFAAYQPIVELSNNNIVGLEALMRLNTKSGKELTASQVLPGIMEPVLSREIGDRMLDFICQDMELIQAAQPGLAFISLNATEADLLSREFPEKLLATLESSHVDPRNVTLEVTETILMVNDSDTVRKVLTKLQASGMKIALDDFGTGFSSLTHLKDFPIDKVKIDQSFVQSICTQHQTRMIVQALIAMAKNMQIGVIAEGIETEDQRRLLLQMGCNLGQGFLISPARDVKHIKLMQLGNRRMGDTIAA